MPCQMPGSMDTHFLCSTCFVVDSAVKKKEEQSNVCINSTLRDPSLVLLVMFPGPLNNPDKFYSFFRMTTENLKKLVDITGMSIYRAGHFQARFIKASSYMLHSEFTMTQLNATRHDLTQLDSPGVNDSCKIA